MLDRLTAADFAPLVGTPFTLDVVGQTVPLVLCTVTPGREWPGRAGRAGFALLFQAATADLLPQGMYPLVHDTIGRLDVFLVPVGRDADGLMLEAVFT